MRGALKNSTQEVRVLPGHGGFMGEQDAAFCGVGDHNAYTVVCGESHFILAPERGGRVGNVQIVQGHMAATGEGLAVYDWLSRLDVNRVSCYVTAIEGLHSLSRLKTAAIRAALKSRGWLLTITKTDDGAETWTMERSNVRG